MRLTTAVVAVFLSALLCTSSAAETPGRPVDRALPVSSDIVPPTKIFDMNPTYPDAAKARHVMGEIKFLIVIDLDGSISYLERLNSIPLLDAAATDAVRRWRYSPATRNGRPVRVFLETTVRFFMR